MKFPILDQTNWSGRVPSRLKLFIILYGSLLLVQAVLFFASFRIEWNHRSALLANSLENLIAAEEKQIYQDLEGISYDLIFLSEIPSDYYFSDRNSSENGKADLIQKLGSVNHRYDQIRILDLLGQETYRLNYQNGQMGRVLPDSLQDKSDRYYFKEMREGDLNTLYFFPMDLNMEQNVVEEPYKPVLRAGIALKNSEGKKLGFLILNYRGELLLNHLRESENLLNSGFEISLLNQKGYWLMGPEDKRNWGFMFPNGRETTIQAEDPELWSKISSAHSGQFMHNGDLYTSRSIRFKHLLAPLRKDLMNYHKIEIEDQDHSYYLYYRVYEETLGQIKKKIISEALPTVLLMQIVLVMMSLILAEMIVRSRKFRKELLHYANVDELTGCLNRRSGTQILEQFLSLERRRGSIMTVSYVDINNLKYVNDHLGHDEGDRYILMMVKMIKDHLRVGDFLVRMGGDEFLIILPDCSKEQAAHIRARMKNQEERVNAGSDLSYYASFSWGAVEISPKEFHDPEKVISQADVMMYKEKNIYHREHPLQVRKD